MFKLHYFRMFLFFFSAVFVGIGFFPSAQAAPLTEQRWTALSTSASAGSGISVEVESQASGLHVSCTLGGVWMRDVELDSVAFTKLEVPGAGVTGLDGAPELPAWRRLIEVPLDATNVRIEMDSALAKASAAPLSANHPICPVQPPQPKTANSVDVKPLVWNKSLYQESGSMLPEAAVVEEYGVIRGHRYVMVTVYPFDYNPASGALTPRKTLDFQIRWEQSKSAATGTDDRLDSPAYAAMLHDSVLNSSGAKSEASSGVEGYLIIVADALAENAQLQTFVDWKQAQGYKVSIATATEAGTTNEGILAYIRTAYTTWALPPTYVLLVGDTDTIPHWVSTQMDNPATDLYYTILDGTEWYTPDVMLGRLPVATEEQLDAALKKILTFEQMSWPASYDGWEQRAAFLAGSDNRSVTEGTHNYVIKTYLTPAAFTSDMLYSVAYGATAASVTDAINAGRSIVAYSGHGGSALWADGPAYTQANVRSLTTEAPPVVLSFACDTAEYTSSECFAETWLRAEHGAAAFFGSSTTSYWGEDDILERVMFEGLFAENSATVGAMIAYGKTKLYQHYSSSTAMMHRYFDMYNTFGDPSMALFTSAVEELDVSHQASLSPVAAYLNVNIAQDGARAALSSEDGVIGVGISASGVAQIPIAEPISATELQLVVTAQNHRPYIASIIVAPEIDGVLSLDETAYTCTDTIQFTLIDADLAGAQSNEITVSCGADTETVVLEEGDRQGILRGSIELACSEAAAGDHVLQVAHDETITAQYEDLNTSTGVLEARTASALVDTQSPVISNVAFVEGTSTTAVITFETNESAQPSAMYGPSYGEPYPSSQSSAVKGVQHTLYLSDLEPSSLYFFQVSAVDGCGNKAVSEEVLHFNTLARMEHFTQCFDTELNDLTNHTITFVPDGSDNYYAASITAASVFPTPINGSNPLSLKDDSSYYIALSGSQFPFYGVNYSGYYVGSNGYITFGKSDVTMLEDIDTHFALPRISAMFNDLDPESGGAIAWMQYTDRAVVTFLNILKYGSNATNSFQIEMFFTGVIRITWLNVESSDGLAGLSDGLGMPADFTETDLTALSDIIPSVTSSRCMGPPSGKAASIEFLVTFSKPVLGVDIPDFRVTTTGVDGAGVENVTPLSDSIYLVETATGVGEGTIRLDVVDDDTITDTLDVPLGGGGKGNGDFTDGDVYTLDNVGPSVVSARVAAPNALYVEFSEAMDAASALDPACYSISGTGQGTLAETPDEVVWVEGNIYMLLWTQGGMVSGGDITVTVNGAEDAAGNSVGESNTSTLENLDASLPMTWATEFLVLLAMAAGMCYLGRMRRAGRCYRHGK